MSRSIGARIFRTFLISSLISLVVVVSFIWFVFDDMEDTLLNTDSQEQLQLLRRDQYLAKNHYWESGGIQAFFKPMHENIEQVPEIFSGIGVPFSGEVEWRDKIYHVYSVANADGDYYLAKDISLFEKREFLFALTLIVLSVAVVLLSIFMAIMANRSLVSPLRNLTLRIKALTPQEKLNKLEISYEDEELNEIAVSFNRFIDEIEAYIQRERLMISMAGHELKTPIAVISGATQIIDQRDQLSVSDKKTFSRIKQSVQEMQENVESLLMLSRRLKTSRTDKKVILQYFLDGLIDEIEFINAEDSQRINKSWQCLESSITTDVVVAKLLIRNLIRNSLNHTKGKILLRLTNEYLDVLDQGGGLPPKVQEWIDTSPTELPVQEGLGLYLVTIACEHLNWTLAQSNLEGWSHGIRLYFKKIRS